MAQNFGLGLRRVGYRSHVVSARGQQVLHQAHRVWIVINYQDSRQAAAEGFACTLATTGVNGGQLPRQVHERTASGSIVAKNTGKTHLDFVDSRGLTPVHRLRCTLHFLSQAVNWSADETIPGSSRGSDPHNLVRPKFNNRERSGRGL